jgi:hypothetical protein
MSEILTDTQAIIYTGFLFALIFGFQHGYILSKDSSE